MKHTVFALFHDSKAAGEAVAELKNMDFTEDISLVAQRPNEDDADTHQIKQDVTDGTVAGAAVGGVTGILAGIIAGLTSVAIPGAGVLLVGGPLLATWGITGGVLGALTGGLVGALVDLGVPEETAKVYEERIRAGEVLVAVQTNHEAEEDVQETLNTHGATESFIVHA
ncbi:DUF1269 domain-containing protein [Candidatus Roizmanbacteria bacterium]|nr:MAG: DUF1269 domain-containing protein [Candidatus Roizmanbacteria bacterium]